MISARFDFAEIAKRSLGAERCRLRPQQHREFVELFTDLLQDADIADIESYRDEKVTFTRERLDQEYAEVESLLTNVARCDLYNELPAPFYRQGMAGLRRRDRRGPCRGK